MGLDTSIETEDFISKGRMRDLGGASFGSSLVEDITLAEEGSPCFLNVSFGRMKSGRRAPPPPPPNAAESFRSRTLEVFTEGVHHASKGRGKDGMDTEGRPVSGRSSRSG